MKNIIHRSLTILMAFLILLSSVGFRFIEHQCMMRAKVAVSIGKKSGDSCQKKVAPSCCAARKQHSAQSSYLKKTECCKEVQKLEKVDVTASIASKLAGKSLNLAADGFIWYTQSFRFIQSQWSNSYSGDHHRPVTFSSLFHGRSMHFFIQSFLI